MRYPCRFLYTISFWLGLFGVFQTGDAGPYKTKNFFYLIIDGIRNNEGFESKDTYMPFVWDSLRPDGVIYENFYNRGITVTNAGHSTLTSGLRQLLVNNQKIPTPVRPQEPTVAEYYRSALSIPQNKVFYISGKSTIWRYPVSLYPGYGYSVAPTIVLPGHGDTAVYHAAIETIDKYHPSLCYVLFPEVDATGHAGDTTKYLGAIQQVDSLIFRLYKKIMNDPLYKDQTAIIITSDHGRHDDAHGGWKEHGDFCHGCRHLAFMALGPDFKKGEVIPTVHDQIDIVPTISHLLGFPVPFAQGDVLTEMLTSYYPEIVLPSLKPEEIRISKETGMSRSCSMARNRFGIHIVYANNSQGMFQTYYSKSLDKGTTWSAPVVLFSDTSGDFSEPVIAAVGDSGLYCAVEGYHYNNTLDSYVWLLAGKRSENNGATWEPVQILDTTGMISGKPSMCTNGNTVSIVAMEPHAMTNIKSDDGGKTFSFNKKFGANGGHPQAPCCAFRNSTCFALWQSINPTDSTYNIYMNHNPWNAGTQQALTDNDTAHYSYQPSVTTDNNGTLHAVYVHLSKPETNEWKLTYIKSAAGNQWSAPKTITPLRTAFHPQILASDNGKIFAVWEDYSQGKRNIWGVYSKDTGQTWGTRSAVTSLQTFSTNPAFTVDGDTLFIAWQDNRLGNWNIYFKRYVFLETGINNQEFTNALMSSDINIRHAAGSMRVQFYLTQRTNVTVSVYNTAGKKVACYKNSDLSTGIHTISVKTQLPTGMYVCKLETSMRMCVKQVVLVK